MTNDTHIFFNSENDKNLAYRHLQMQLCMGKNYFLLIKILILKKNFFTKLIIINL